MRKLLIIVIVMCLIATMFVGCGKKSEVVDSGNQNPQPTATVNPVENEPKTDISNLTDAEIYNFDPATKTLKGFQEEIVGVTDIVIPSTIDGVEVQIIGANAFGSLGLNSVVLPDTLKTIGDGAFADNNLTEIILPGNLTSIERFAFDKNKLTEVTIPQGVTDINIGIFSHNQIAKVTLPDRITVIGQSSFTDNKLKELIVPPMVKVIESYAFADNLLEKIEFNDGLEKIDGRAFSGNNLTSITIPASVKSIGLPTEGATPISNFERFTFAYNPKISSITMLGSNTELEASFLVENNNFRTAYLSGGAGTYTGSQYGKWEKSN